MRFNTHLTRGAMLTVVAIAAATTLAGCASGGGSDEIVIRVADFPEDDVLDELGIDSEFGLLGLFQGVGLAHGSATPRGWSRWRSRTSSAWATAWS